MRTSAKLACVVAATTAIAAFAAIGQADPAGDAPPEDTGLSLTPVPGSQSITSRGADPGGGPPWAVRRYRSVSGAICTQVGREVRGEIGRLRAGGEFTPEDPSDGGTCAPTEALEAEVFALSIKHYVDHPDTPAAEPERVVVSGVARLDVQRVEVAGGGEVRTLYPSAGRTFLTVFDRDADRRGIIATAYLTDGSRRALGPFPGQ